MASFDPYQAWLGIPPHDQPPNLYRLLGLVLFESNPERHYGGGPNGSGHMCCRFNRGPTARSASPFWTS